MQTPKLWHLLTSSVAQPPRTWVFYVKFYSTLCRFLPFCTFGITFFLCTLLQPSIHVLVGSIVPTYIYIVVYVHVMCMQVAALLIFRPIQLLASSASPPMIRVSGILKNILMMFFRFIGQQKKKQKVCLTKKNTKNCPACQLQESLIGFLSCSFM